MLLSLSVSIWSSLPFKAHIFDQPNFQDIERMLAGEELMCVEQEVIYSSGRIVRAYIISGWIEDSIIHLLLLQIILISSHRGVGLSRYLQVQVLLGYFISVVSCRVAVRLYNWAPMWGPGWAAWTWLGPQGGKSHKNGFYRSLLRGADIYNNLEMELSLCNMTKTDKWQFDTPLVYLNSNMTKYTSQYVYNSHMFIFIGEVALIPWYVNRSYSNCSIFISAYNCWRKTF